MGEAPNRPVIHFETAAGKLRHEGAQGEVSLRDALPKKGGMRAHHKPPPVAAIFPAAALPVVRNRCDHFTTLEALMLSVRATKRPLSPA
jgi:hypothetical protein